MNACYFQFSNASWILTSLDAFNIYHAFFAVPALCFVTTHALPKYTDEGRRRWREWTCDQDELPPGRSNDKSVNDTPETRMLSFWWNFRHWMHRNLSKWQPQVQPVTIVSKRHFRFGDQTQSMIVVLTALFSLILPEFVVTTSSAASEGSSFVEQIDAKIICIRNMLVLWRRADGVCHLAARFAAILVPCGEVKSLQLIWRWKLRVASTETLKTKGGQFDNFVVTGGTGSCHFDNLRCHQWRQSYQIDDLLFSVNRKVVRMTALVATGDVEASTSPVTTRAATVTTSPFLCWSSNEL